MNPATRQGRRRVGTTAILLLLLSGTASAEKAKDDAAPPPIFELHEGTARETKYLGVVLVTDFRGASDKGGSAGACRA